MISPCPTMMRSKSHLVRASMDRWNAALSLTVSSPPSRKLTRVLRRCLDECIPAPQPPAQDPHHGNGKKGSLFHHVKKSLLVDRDQGTISLGHRRGAPGS